MFLCIIKKATCNLKVAWFNSVHNRREKVSALSGLTLAQNFLKPHFSRMERLEPSKINLSQDFSQKVVSTSCFVFNFLPNMDDFSCLLITFADSLDPEQARQNVFVRPDLDPICFDTLKVLRKSNIQRVKYGTIRPKLKFYLFPLTQPTLKNSPYSKFLISIFSQDFFFYFIANLENCPMLTVFILANCLCNLILLPIVGLCSKTYLKRPLKDIHKLTKVIKLRQMSTKYRSKAFCNTFGQKYCRMLHVSVLQYF